MNVRQDVFDAVQSQIDLDIDFKKLCAEIYFHPGGDTLRLSFKGLVFLSDYLPSNKVDVLIENQNRKTMPSKHYVFLTRYNKMPYYIGGKYITFFDEDAAFLFKMCDGDIENVKEVTK